MTECRVHHESGDRGTQRFDRVARGQRRHMQSLLRRAKTIPQDDANAAGAYSN
ncbi:hypothetical protein [Rhizobium sp.]|uniref:hypothetical protein n=1 Tax=Rhizobium sp. TaxID=391 RepID=UPI003917F6C2